MKTAGFSARFILEFLQLLTLFHSERRNAKRKLIRIKQSLFSTGILALKSCCAAIRCVQGSQSPDFKTND